MSVTMAAITGVCIYQNKVCLLTLKCNDLYLIVVLLQPLEFIYRVMPLSFHYLGLGCTIEVSLPLPSPKVLSNKRNLNRHKCSQYIFTAKEGSDL